MKDRSFYQNSSKLEVIALAKSTDHPESWRKLMQMLTPLQAKIVMVIYEREPLSVSAISRYSFTNEQTVSSVLFNMKKWGIVSSTKGQDLRFSNYSLYPGLKKFLLLGERKAS